MSIKIKRVSTVTILNEVYGLFQDVFKDHPVVVNPIHSYTKWKERYLDNSNILLYAESDEKIVGLAFGRLSEENSVILGPVCVQKDFRKQGIAKQLIHNLEEKAKLDGRSYIHLGSVESAEHFYKELGYKGALLIQSELHTIDEILTLKEEYDVLFTKTYNETISQVCLQVEIDDKQFRGRVENSDLDCHVIMMFRKKL